MSSTNSNLSRKPFEFPDLDGMADALSIKIVWWLAGRRRQRHGLPLPANWYEVPRVTPGLLRWCRQQSARLVIRRCVFF